MDEDEETEQIVDVKSYLFNIAKAMIQLLETPAVFLIKKDFMGSFMSTLYNVYRCVNKGNSKEQLMDIIVDYHLEWLQSVSEIEEYNSHVKEITINEITDAIYRTMTAVSECFLKFKLFAQEKKQFLECQDQVNIQLEIEVMDEMQTHIMDYLKEKTKCYINSIGRTDLEIKFTEQIVNLLEWLDQSYDRLSLQCALATQVDVHLTSDLTKTLQRIVEELSAADTPASRKLLEILKERGLELGNMMNCHIGYELEMSKIAEKLGSLESRIKRLEDENSLGLMGLKKKKNYLEKRIISLDQLKCKIKKIQKEADCGECVEESDECLETGEPRIFNHLLPAPERELLVKHLCSLWNVALGKRTLKSVLSILSAVDSKEEFTDEYGTFYVDRYGRKIYRKEGDTLLYQQNENDELVLLSDDSEHIYFYDECGRYFVDEETRQRIYKANDMAIEYTMGASGNLHKYKEVVNGVTYKFDSYGRYYVDHSGKNIYREEDAESEYENDGLGNLVRIRSQFDLFSACPLKFRFTPDSEYLKRNVGLALRKCLAAVVLYQPADPIKCLAAALMKFHEQEEERARRAKEKAELLAARALKLEEQRKLAEQLALEAALLERGASEGSCDSNLIDYQNICIETKCPFLVLD